MLLKKFTGNAWKKEGKQITCSSLLAFVPATVAQRNFLVDFAIVSNDTYGTRTACRKVAVEVFQGLDHFFANGIVETLCFNGHVIGFYSIKKFVSKEHRFPYELGHLFVKAGLQGKGFGTLLFQRAVSMASEQGWESLQWLSDPGAKGFYLKLGASIIGSSENLLNPSQDLLVFTYTLPTRP